MACDTISLVPLLAFILGRIAYSCSQLAVVLRHLLELLYYSRFSSYLLAIVPVLRAWPKDTPKQKEQNIDLILCSPIPAFPPPQKTRTIKAVHTFWSCSVPFSIPMQELLLTIPASEHHGVSGYWTMQACELKVEASCWMKILVSFLKCTWNRVLFSKMQIFESQVTVEPLSGMPRSSTVRSILQFYQIVSENTRKNNCV